mmetsp:Transcript_4241/g.15592  ORF Transcript_4241/g.15592 Transcript_4241/m.15592 type:complete len:110 (+) Transcript_4241:167-496(+)
MVRLKSRYLIVEMIWSSTNQDCACPSGVSKGVVMQAVKDSVLRNFGDVGMARLQNRMQSIAILDTHLDGTDAHSPPQSNILIRLPTSSSSGQIEPGTRCFGMRSFSLDT